MQKKVTNALVNTEGLDSSLVERVDSFMRVALSLAIELVQTKRVLARTKYAEQIAKQRRAGRNF